MWLVRYEAGTGKHSNQCEWTTVKVGYQLGTRCNAGRHIMKPKPDGTICGKTCNMITGLVQGQLGWACNTSWRSNGWAAIRVTLSQRCNVSHNVA